MGFVRSLEHKAASFKWTWRSLGCSESCGGGELGGVSGTRKKYRKIKIDPRSCERNLCNCVKKPEKISGLQRGLNP